MGMSPTATLFYGYVWKNQADIVSDEFESHWSLQDELKDQYGVEIGRYCYSEYPIPMIYVSESRVVAYDDAPKEITDLTIGDDWNDNLLNFIEAAEVEMEPQDEYDEGPEGPGWFMVTYYG